MKKTLYIICLSVLIALGMYPPAAIASEAGDWLAIPASKHSLPFEADPYRLYTLRLPANYLPVSVGSQTKISIPTPDGSFESFLVSNTPIMEAALAAKYPHIQTYSGTSLQKPGGSIKISTDGAKLYYYVQHTGYSYYINAIGGQDYMVFYKHDAQKQAKHSFDCQHIGSPNLDPDEEWYNQHPLNTLDFAFGTQRRKYRIAIGATYEYSNAVTNNNPTKAGVLAAMVTTMNRVNGVYERNLGITFELIAKNDTLIYTTAADPYTNNDPDAMLNQNKTTLNNRIGVNNYDIGHVFSTGGGGLAMLASLCDNFYKAQGVTGTNNPVGDPFDIDYVCHELGHQVGADHTQNKCFEENAATAFEPGSGSTIMGYAGLCDANDIQSNSMDFFHPISLYEMSQHIGDIPTCGNILGSTHAAPAPFVISNNLFDIPANTAFELEGPVLNDVDDYNWMQWNRGNFKQNESLGGNFNAGPTFKSLAADTLPLRIFPQLNKVLNNTYSTLGERIPQVNRMLYFRLMTRKFDNNWGTFKLSDDSIKINVVGNTTGFAITYPNSTGISLKPADTMTVKWDVSNSAAAPINCDKVNILLSYNGGKTFPTTLAADVPNTGSYQVTMPDTVHAQLRIKVKGANNIFFDINNANFKLDDNIGIQPLMPAVASMHPVPFQDQLSITMATAHTIIITDVMGRNMHKQAGSDLHINTQQWSSGIYLVQVYNAQQQLVQTTKVIKQ